MPRGTLSRSLGQKKEKKTKNKNKKEEEEEEAAAAAAAAAAAWGLEVWTPEFSSLGPPCKKTLCACLHPTCQLFGGSDLPGCPRTRHPACVRHPKRPYGETSPATRMASASLASDPSDLHMDTGAQTLLHSLGHLAGCVSSSGSALPRLGCGFSSVLFCSVLCLLSDPRDLSG